MELLATVRRFREHRELVAARRAADRELLRSRLASPRLAWRTNELCSAEHRHELADSIVEIVRASWTRQLPGASPLDRAAASGEASLLLEIAALLADRQRPVTPRGVLLVERVVGSDESPLFNHGAGARLHVQLTEALQVLEGRT
jgi:hypothetical protein